MVDFLTIGIRYPKKGLVDIYPKFVVKNSSSDLMIRGGDFYAVWLEEDKRWSTDEQDVIDMVDRELDRYAKSYQAPEESRIQVLHMWDAETGMIDRWHKYCQKQMRDNFKPLDEKIIFANTDVKKRDYASKRLSYPLIECETPAYDKLMSVLYSPEERHKIEWAIGSIVNGDSKKIQKFITLYGPPGSGKGTVLEIIDRLFDGYCTTFSAKNLGLASAQFALEPFKNNPLVGIQTDGNLSRIEDNSRLNSLISHEKMIVNEKHKTQYTAKFKTFLFLGTNSPVKITDAKSGLLRRLIDVNPSGNKIPKREYDKLMDTVSFELGGIAFKCQKVYEDNPRYYDSYVPEKMISSTNDFYNFVLDHYFEFAEEDFVTLTQAWEMYKSWCDDSKIQYPLNKRAFKDELLNYFAKFEERAIINGDRIRSVFSGFKINMFKAEKKEEVPKKIETWLKFESAESIFDKEFADCKAQLANGYGTPSVPWATVKTTLKDVDTSKVHYIYEGDPEELDPLFDDHIEVKVQKGNAALRRKLTKCCNIAIAVISSGLKRKEKKKVINEGAIKSERKLRELIERNLRKEIHPGTKPSIDFIYKILEDAYSEGMKYDVSDMRQSVLTFAMGSSHQADYCVKMVGKMKFKSEEFSEGKAKMDELVFFDIEVYPNLLLVCWKVAEDIDWEEVKTVKDKNAYFLDKIKNHKKKIVRMYNPKPVDIEKLLEYKLVGFNCRKYDNHILYGRMMGYTTEMCYKLSKKMIVEHKGYLGGAYDLSYTDVLDFCSKKQGLKKWEIELGFHHQEMGLSWDQPVDEKLWPKIGDYCDNDVLATELVFLCRQEDWKARKILADLSGGYVNMTTNNLVCKLIFGNEKRPMLVYTDLATGKQSVGR